jgi:hypothetical protein
MSVCGQCGARVTTPASCLNGHDQPERPPIPIDTLAIRIAQELAPMVADELRAGTGVVSAGEPAGLVTTRELARQIGMSPRFVYDHQDELGVTRMGPGPKAPLRFDPDRSKARLAELQEQGVVKTTPRLERRELPENAPLLPVRGGMSYHVCTPAVVGRRIAAKAAPAGRVNARPGPNQRRVSSDG